MILCPFGCGERLYPAGGKHSNAEQAELDKHRRECVKLREPGAQTKAAAVLESVKDPVASPRAARWALFAAHALQGLLASPMAARAEGVRCTELASLFADDLLAEHDARFKP